MENKRIILAIKQTLEEWERLDEWHRGVSFEKAKEHIEKWKSDLEAEEGVSK